MLIKWNGSGLGMVPLLGGKENEKFLQGGTNNYGQVRLMPGWNQVSERNWELMAPHLKDQLEQGTAEIPKKAEWQELVDDKKKPIVGEDGKPVMGYTNTDLADIRADLGRKIVAETWNFETLELWMDDMSLSSELRNYIQKQYDETFAKKKG